MTWPAVIRLYRGVDDMHGFGHHAASYVSAKMSGLQA